MDALGNHCSLVCKGGGTKHAFSLTALTLPLAQEPKQRSARSKSKVLGTGGLWQEAEWGWGAKNLGLGCRVKVLLDVPMRQPKTKLGVAGTSHPKFKANEDCVLIFHFGFNKKI